MMEQGLMRVYASKQTYKVIEIDTDTPFDKPVMTEKYSHPNLHIVTPTDCSFQRCQYSRQMVIGIFDLVVCVERQDAWRNEPPEYVNASLMTCGVSIQETQAEAEKWFYANRDLVNPVLVGRFGTNQTPVLLAIPHRKPYVPKTPSN